ncbi:hypothetical protein JKF63_06860 [Porcisia hertigi]|uniref:Surface antigen-like protein n=1 Tax=Porcisia hertigi TaxID=2761500 RepID=A0A836LJ96_9TRYP|nr:hypothetical protein JKF63_06860 [Porcisia hertigi]
MTHGVRRLSTTVVVAVVYILLLSGGVSRATLTALQNATTAAFLQAFTVSMPGLADVWIGENWCTWPYIRCSSDTDIAVVIDNAGLTGSLPELNVTGKGTPSHVALTEISLTNVNITGGFKDSWGNLRLLRVLNFTNTNLFGTIPMSWNSMRSLEVVVLKNSSACGSLPSWTRRSLKTIDVQNNVLRGPLPETWGYMTGLQHVNLNANNFCGCNPPSWLSRVLTNALFRAMGSAPFDDNCRAAINCASEGAKCSRSTPQYRDAAVSPSRVFVVLSTLICTLMIVLM